MKKKLTDAERLSMLIKQQCELAKQQRDLSNMLLMQVNSRYPKYLSRPYTAGIVCKEVKECLNQVLNVHVN